MARSPGESKIPVFHTNPLKSKISKPLSTLSSRVRAHLDASKSRASTSVIFSILSAGGGNVKNVANQSLSGPVSSSHDDLKTQTASRPTNIFLPNRFLPTVTKREPTVNADHIGKRVRLGSGKEGVLRFFGQTQFGEGVWCGVELDGEDGSTDGSVNNVRYFSCPAGRGVFALVENVEAVAEVREYLSDVSDSGPHSLLGITADLDQIQHENEKTYSSDASYLRKEHPFRYSASHLHQSSQMSTPTPNSSNGSYVPPGEWKCGSQHSSSAGSLALSNRGLGIGVDTLSASFQMSKHSSFECDESLGILTPDQMGELTTCSDGGALGGGSCDDFSALTFPDNNTDSASKTDLVAIEIKYPSLDNIMDVPSAVENSEECYPCLSQPLHTELVERLYSENDTCMMSVSSISDHIEPIKEQKFDIAQRTPSLEELPVDDLSTTLVAPEQPTDTNPVPAPSTTSFVTSVTSIGSWDNGYQGDGECSRPTSRGADASPLARVPKMVSKVLDPMTDSDFYTESDADLYDDATCQRGDRKARVIDGKLFGSPGSTKMITSQSYTTKVIAAEQSDTSHERGAPSEEMDSSGIYSDLEKKLDAAEKTTIEVVLETPPLPEEIHSDASANSSSKSVSSQKLVVNDEKSKTNEIDKIEKPVAPIKPTKTPSKAPIHAKPENSLKRRNDRSVNVVKKDNLKSGESSAMKPKMPRRNVASKVKTLISGSSKGSEDENQENHQPNPNKNHAKKANGKWDSVISKIEKSRIQEKCKPEKLKDIKSKVVCGMPRVNQSKLHKDVKIFSPNGNAINKVTPSKTSAATLSGSTSSLKDLPSGHRVKTRKTRTRLGIESPSQSTSTVLASISQASSRNSSVTDISDSHVDISQHSLPAVVLATEYPRGKKTSSLLCSPLSEGAVPCVALPLPSSQANGNVKISTLPRTKTNLKPTIGSVNSLIENSSSAMKVPKKNIHRRTLPKVVPLRDQNRLANGSAGACSTNKTALKPLANDHRSHESCKNGKTKSKTTAVQISKVNPLLSQLKYTADGMEAFIILFQRLTADMDVFTLPYIKRELTKYKSEWLDMKMKLEEANVSCKRLKEDIETQQALHEHKLEELRQAHTEKMNALNTCHKEEFGKQSENYEKQLKEMEEKLKTRETLLELKFKEDLRSIQREAESKLESILEETKRQVEILRCENEAWKQRLRNESKKSLDDAENKVKLQIELIESKYERRLNEAAEELRKKEEQFVAFSNKRAENLLKRKLSNVNEEHAFEGKPNAEQNGIPHGFKMEFQNLEEEVCSLRTVLELKHSEIQDLRKLNEKLHSEVQDLPFIMQKLDSAQARVEDLNAQLQTKTEVEKHLLKENRKLTDIVHAETEKRKRLTFQNEELLWKLKRSSQVAKTLAVFNSSQSKEHSVSESEVTCHSTPVNTNKHCHKQLNFSRSGCEKYLKRSRTDNDLKPSSESPTEADISSKVLGVVEKSDSVSWVLEIDESPIEVASRMLRRANSLRGVPSKKKVSHTRQLLTLPTRSKKHDGDVETSKVDFGVQCCDIDSTLDQLNISGNTILRSSVENGDTPKVKVIDEPIEASQKINDEDDNIILDISSIFDFLQDSDFDTDTPLTSEENNVVGFFPTDKALRLPFSTSSSSNSSLDLEVYSKDGHFEWVSDQNAGIDKGIPRMAPSDSCSSSSTSHSVSDIDDSESTDVSSSSYVDGDGKEKTIKG